MEILISEVMQLTQKSRNRVPLVLDTVGKCLCPACPVQENSRCVSELKTGMDEALKSNPLKTEEVPGVYCGTGKATCTDLNSGQPCMCTDCAVFAQFSLANARPSSYYCQAGASG